MIHASSRSRRVVVTEIDTPYYRKRYIGAKRIAQLAPDSGLEKLASGIEVSNEEDLPEDPQDPAAEPAAPEAPAVEPAVPESEPPSPAPTLSAETATVLPVN
jgi:hypothetical protein